MNRLLRRRQFNRIRSYLQRHQAALVLSMGIAGALLLGVALWILAPAGESGGEASASKEGGRRKSISPVFTAEVRHWEPEILEWAEEYELDPDQVATLMQIESCGDPEAVSGAGAQGLFQVMPFHFEEGENMRDPETNARRGLGFYVEMLALTEGHVGMAFAGYNGGHVAAQGSWDGWAEETRRYYRWGSGIYYDAASGLEDSPTLHDWLAAGGASLCRQAAARLGLQ